MTHQQGFLRSSFSLTANNVFSDREEQVWVWEYESEDGKRDMFMDEGEEIQFRVVEELFVDTSPTTGEQIMSTKSNHTHLNTLVTLPPSSAQPRGQYWLRHISGEFVTCC